MQWGWCQVWTQVSRGHIPCCCCCCLPAFNYGKLSCPIKEKVCTWQFSLITCLPLPHHHHNPVMVKYFPSDDPDVSGPCVTLIDLIILLQRAGDVLFMSCSPHRAVISGYVGIGLHTITGWMGWQRAPLSSSLVYSHTHTKLPPGLSNQPRCCCWWRDNVEASGVWLIVSHQANGYYSLWEV